jgi:hypothetical protein
MPSSSPEYSHALPSRTLKLLLEPPPFPFELDEATSLLELSDEGELGDSEHAKTAKEIAVANVETVILIIIHP